MYILDTNVVSEFIKEHPDPRVEGWLNRGSGREYYISVITELELRKGVRSLVEGTKRTSLVRKINRLFDEMLEGRILPFSRQMVEHYLEFSSNRKALGLHVPTFDCQIAATCKSHNMTIVTRNVKDFFGMDVKIVNPWQE